MMERHSKSEINHVIIKMFFVSFARFLINSCFFFGRSRTRPLTILLGCVLSMLFGHQIHNHHSL